MPGGPELRLLGAVARCGGDPGAELWRIGASFRLPVDEILPDGTYLSRLKAPRKLRKDGAADITVRVIEYRLEDEHGEVTETFTLITTLLTASGGPRTGGAVQGAMGDRDRAGLAEDPGERRRGGAAVQDSRRGHPGDLGAAVRHHAVGDLTRRGGPGPPGPAAHLFRQRPRHRARPGRTAGSFSPLTGWPGWSPHPSPSSPRSPAANAPAGQTRARPSAAPAIPPSPPTPGSGLNPRTAHPGHAADAGTRRHLS